MRKSESFRWEWRGEPEIEVLGQLPAARQPVMTADAKDGTVPFPLGVYQSQEPPQASDASELLCSMQYFQSFQASLGYSIT